jgi:THO complex subunit 2
VLFDDDNGKKPAVPPPRERSLQAQVESYFPPEDWQSISPELYQTFWSLSLYDLKVPNKAYGRVAVW